MPRVTAAAIPAVLRPSLLGLLSVALLGGCYDFSGFLETADAAKDGAETTDAALAPAVWQELFPSVRPPARFYHAMVTDGARGVVVLYGGTSAIGAKPFADTWEWNGSAWRDVSPAGATPGPRVAASMTWDAHRKRVVLFGGYSVFAAVQGRGCAAPREPLAP